MRKQTENFQAETKELLNLMIHSIYTNKEIFLRELISNASDAIDKLKFKSLTDTELLKDSKDFKIEIKVDKDKNQLIIEDTGIGMTFNEVNENIGTIAKSGSKAFIEKFKEAKENEQLDIIGQFGVGFYSAFMVSSDITLYTKSPYSDVTIKWSSKGDGTYEIEEIENLEDLKRGTRIVLTINEESKEFLEDYKIRTVVRKHSNSIKYPIYFGEEKLNDETPLWKKDKKDITEEQYNEFYKNTFYDHEDPLLHFHLKVQGSLEYTALIYIPKRTPMDFYTRDYKRGLQLYTKNVFIMENAESLIPEYFSFMKGIVDTDNLSLNISREILQQDNELIKISKNIEKKIETELKKMIKDDREKYITLWEAFGRTIKFGVQDMFGINKEKLQDLLIFKSSFEDKYTTLKEYVERMKEEQKEIYYVTGENEEFLKVLPKVKVFKDKGFEVLYLTDRIDEFTLKTLMKYDEKMFKSINDSDLSNLEDEKEKETRENLEKENKTLLEKIKNLLGEKIEEVRLNNNLGSGAVGLASKGEISLEMEKTLSEIPGNENIKAQKILEFNPTHPLFEKIKNISDEDELKDLLYVLYNQSLLIEGLQIENPVEFAEKLNKIISK
ncbi:MAG: molecular chaperone HtpG [Fusobacterium perfoetens]|uniref:molecular chaperone HtpG n=1 Tax=Fusobacterium perfoetens TaxID=852 RepID=UPI0023F43E97|nr:molecular chaperone HtpG [Fusobacterium perfoetens]MCI6152308.1 molecular chaperone HtpG [Fusobacterium perfoetens]MDY3238166.1 molecular chaperone HtpG [Fusobacterium perfoetens]